MKTYQVTAGFNNGIDFVRFLKTEGKHITSRVQLWSPLVDEIIFSLDISEDDLIVLTLRFGLKILPEESHEQPAAT